MGFGLIFWGILFLFSFRIQGFDILPDIIGYILIFNGLKALLDKSDHFVTARKFCLPLIILSIFDIYQKPNHTSGIHFNPILSLIGLVSIILLLFLFYYICQGMKEWARENSNHELAEKTENRWKHFLIMHIISFASILLIFIPPLAIAFVLVALIYSIVVLVMMMQLMKEAEVALPLE